MRADALAAIEALQREGYDALGAEVTAAANDDDDDDSDVGAPTEVVVSPSVHATPAMSVAADQPQQTPATWQDLTV